MTLKVVICKLFSAVALLLMLPVAACTSPNTGGGGSSSTLTACHVTASDLSIPGGGKSSAPTLPAGTLSIDGSTALAPLFQQAAGNVSAQFGKQQGHYQHHAQWFRHWPE